MTARLAALVRYASVVTWDADLAEDIVQNVLVRAQARWERIRRLDAPERYFYESPSVLEVDQRLAGNDLALTVRFRQGGARTLTREEFLAAAEAIELRG
ncbi:hypothetical protein ACQP2P_33380 [Dactylosporangium sp. CA-139114]|uniref:hypothetical protein n=1 Tax=Dactylosporangium sp. CA-139114 TaxID=3239931 RepID=UPI003D9929DD